GGGARRGRRAGGRSRRGASSRCRSGRGRWRGAGRCRRWRTGAWWRTGEGRLMEVKATAKYQRFSPRKARLVTDLIQGKSAAEAIAMLEHLGKGSALPIGRVVRSAVANAENNFNMTMENLYVKKAMADE